MSSSKSCALMPPTMITFTESARKSTAWCRARNFGYFETMLLLAPDLADLWQEAGILHARLGNMRAALDALGRFVAQAPETPARHQAAALIQQLKTKLN